MKLRARRFAAPVLAAALLCASSSSFAADTADQTTTGVNADDPAAPPVDAEKPYWRRSLARRFFEDQKYLVTTWWPAEFRRGGFTGPLVAGVALAQTSSRDGGEGADMELSRYIRSETRNHGTMAARRLSFVGDGAAGAVLIGTGYLIGRWTGHERLAEASSLAAEAALDAGLWSSALKTITARPRPGSDSNGAFFQFHGGVIARSNGSFPSGHATGAFAVATVFAGVYHEHRWAPWVAYGTAGLIGVSRLTLGRHYPSDVLVGGVLGTSIGRMVLARSTGGASEPLSSLAPMFSPDGRGAGLVWTRSW